MTRAARQLNKFNSSNSQKSKGSKGKSLSVKTSERLKAKVTPDKESVFTPVRVGAAIKTRKTLRKASKMHNEQSERSRRNASQCCADCKLVVHKREQLRLRASLGIKLCDSCWGKRNIKTPNKPQKSLITKSCEIKLVDICRTTDSSLNLHAAKKTTPLKRKREHDAFSDEGNKKLKLQNSVNLEESAIETDVKTESPNESNYSQDDNLIFLQKRSKESCGDSKVKEDLINSDFQIPVSNLSNDDDDDLKQASKYDPDNASTIETANDKELHTPETMTKIIKKLPGKMTAEAKFTNVSGQRINNKKITTKSRASRRISNLNKTTNEDGEKVASSNLRKTYFKRMNKKPLSGKINNSISNLASSVRPKTCSVSNENVGKGVKVPFKKNVSKRLSNLEILEALNSDENVEVCGSISSRQQNHKSIMKRKKLRGKEVPLLKKSPIKRREKSSQSYTVTKVKQMAANKKKSNRKGRVSGSKLFFCAVCNKDFISYSESKLHEISHDCRYPVLILHRCDSAQGVLSLIREVDFPSYDTDPLEKGEMIKSDELNEQNSAGPNNSDSSPGKCSLSALNKETKDSRKIIVRQKICSDTSKQPTEGKQDELVVMLEEMFGSCNDDSASSNQVKYVDGEIKGPTDGTALVEVLDESFKKEKRSDISDRNSIKIKKKPNRKLKIEENVGQLNEDAKDDERPSTRSKLVRTTRNVRDTVNATDAGSICGSEIGSTAGDKNPSNVASVVNETDEAKIHNDKNDVSTKVEGSQITWESELETVQSKDCEYKTTIPEAIEELPIEDRVPPYPVTSEKDEVKNDNLSQDDSDSHADECIVSDGAKLVDEHNSQGENCEVSENKQQLSEEVQEDDLDKTDEKDTNLIKLDKMATEGETHTNMKTEQETHFCANTFDSKAQLNEGKQKTEEISEDTVKESEKQALNDLTSSESKMQDSVSRGHNESRSENAFQIQSETGNEEKQTVNSDVKYIAEDSETVNSGKNLVPQQLNNSKETTDQAITPSDSSPQIKIVDNEMHKDSCEMEQSKCLSNDKIVSANENNISEATDSLSVLNPVSNETEEKANTDLMKLKESTAGEDTDIDINSEKEKHISGNTIDGDIQLSEDIHKTAEMSEDSESCSFKFDAIDEPGILENSSRSSNGEILSDLITTCESGVRVKESVSESKNISAVECVTEGHSEVQDASKCDDIDILIKEVLESNSLESDKSNSEDVTELLTDGGVSNNNNNGCVQNNTSGNFISDESSLACDKSSSIKPDTKKGEAIPLDNELNLEPVSDDEMNFI